MRKALILLGLLFLSASARAWSRLGDESTPSFNDTGTRRICFSLALSSTTATLVYSGDDGDRETLFQNLSSTYDVYLTTFSTVSATAARMVVRKGTDLWTNNSGNLYGYIEAAGSGVTLVGCTEYDGKD